MVSQHIRYFDAEKIMNSGQIFRMYRRADGFFRVYSKNRCLVLKQDGENVDFYCSDEEFDGYWKNYFDLNRDYDSLAERVIRSTKDEFLCSACSYGMGIRVLNQDIWEMMISFIISQQKQIPSIRKCVEALCARFGERVHLEIPDVGISEDYFTFPTPESIAAAGPDGVKGLSLGYRERYIYETSVDYIRRAIPEKALKEKNFEDAKKYFCSFCGIGEKVANCICLFAAGYVDAFPIDVHIKDILYREYGDSSIPKDKMRLCDYEKLIDKHFGMYKGFRGIVQQWIFAYELD